MLGNSEAIPTKAFFMTPTDRYDEALAYASRLHRTQTRKGSGIPYIAHLLSVSALVLEHGGDEDQAIAGLLHDAAEDQGGKAQLETIRQQFGETVAQIVADCTDAWTEPKPPWRARKEAYLAALPTKQDSSLLVSLADKTHNAEAIVSDKREIGDAIFQRFTGRRDGTIWYYKALADVFAQKKPGVLADRLAKAVTEMADEPTA